MTCWVQRQQRQASSLRAASQGKEQLKSWGSMGTVLTEPLREDESVRVWKVNRMWKIPEVGRTDERHENIVACEDAGLECYDGKRGGTKGKQRCVESLTHPARILTAVSQQATLRLLFAPFSHEETKSQKEKKRKKDN